MHYFHVFEGSTAQPPDASQEKAPVMSGAAVAVNAYARGYQMALESYGDWVPVSLYAESILLQNGDRLLLLMVRSVEEMKR
jgi:hypothetical protein